MSYRDKKIILAIGIIILFVVMICFVRPVLTAQFEAYMEAEEDKQTGSVEVQDETEQSETVEVQEETKQSETAEVQDEENQSGDGTRQEESESSKNVQQAVDRPYRFRNRKLLLDHYEKHGIEMGFDSAQGYEKAAAAVAQNPDALHKIEAEDGDDVYYLQATNEFVIVSTDGYIRTYFKPNSGIKYFNRQ